MSIVFAAAAAWGCTLTGEGTYHNFGEAVAGAGDIDGDGYADAVVGAYGVDDYTGRIYLYRGGPGGLSDVPSTTIDGEDVHDDFGYRVAGAGDVNGDGYADVVVGAPNHGFYAGRVYLFLGGPSGLETTPATTLDGADPFEYLGMSVAGAGDVNGDGYDDVVVGRPGDLDLSHTGAAFVFLGGSTGLDSSPVASWYGSAAGDQLGATVAGAGDVDGDGYADVMVAAVGASSGAGAVYVYSGSPTGPGSTPVTVWVGSAPSGGLGSALAGVGDVNGDGYDDVVIGASSLGGSRAYLGLGSAAGLPLAPSQRIATDYGAVALAAAGDVNGDGYADVVGGLQSWGPSVEGVARIFYGSSDGLRRPARVSVAGDSPGGELGAAVIGLGDTDGDGFDDVLVGAPAPDGLGHAYLVVGHADLEVSVRGALQAGQPATLDVTHATTDASVRVYAGSAVTRSGPCPDDLHGLCLGLSHATLVGDVLPNADGTATISGDVPASIGDSVVLEAVSFRSIAGGSAIRSAPVVVDVER